MFVGFAIGAVVSFAPSLFVPTAVAGLLIVGVVYAWETRKLRRERPDIFSW
jgi:hypothetical protein